MSTDPAVSRPDRALARSIDACLTRDRHRLRRQSRALEEGSADAAARDALREAVERSAATVAQRLAALPAIRYPEELPVSERKGDIAAAIRDHPVVIVSG